METAIACFACWMVGLAVGIWCGTKIGGKEMSRRYDRDLCQSCAKWSAWCPWAKEAIDQLTGKENNGIPFEALVLERVVFCSEHEEERRGEM